MFIPTIKTKMKLLEDWTFKLHSEHRNESMWEALGIRDQYQQKHTTYWDDNWQARLENPIHYEEVVVDATIPSATVLQVDRIYIRKGAGDYDSITFIVIDSPDKRFLTRNKGGSFLFGKACRFWAKLEDVNTMEVEVV